MNSPGRLVARILRKVATIKDDDQKQREYMRLHRASFSADLLQETERDSVMLHRSLQQLSDAVYLLACPLEQLVRWDSLTDQLEDSLYLSTVRIIRLRTKDVTEWIPEKANFRPRNSQKQFQTAMHFGSDSDSSYED